MEPDADLIAALKNRDGSAVRAALEQGANPNTLSPSHYLTVLYWVVDNDDTPGAALLLEFGASPNIVARGGSPPLGIALSHGIYPMVELLLRYGADPRLRSAPYEGTDRVSPSPVETMVNRTFNALGDRNAAAAIGTFPLWAVLLDHAPSLLTEIGNSLPTDGGQYGIFLEDVRRVLLPALLQALQDRGRADLVPAVEAAFSHLP